MTFRLGKKSKQNYELLDSDMRRVVMRVLGYGVLDFFIACTYRTRGEQNRLFDAKKSKVKWPRSKHNHKPALAMDLVPWVAGKPSWNHYHCSVLAGLVMAAAFEEGVRIRWGGNWDMDGEPITDQSFQDLAHFEKRSNEN